MPIAPHMAVCRSSPHAGAPLTRHCRPVQDMKIERVEDMLDDIREQGDQLTQIQDAMKQPLGYAPDVDDADLEAELEVTVLSLPAVILDGYYQSVVN